MHTKRIFLQRSDYHSSFSVRAITISIVGNAKILIVDDDKELNALLSAYLGRFNFEVKATTSPNEALALLKTEALDLIVLDVMLPEKNGFELCQEIRRTSKIPIVMLTARGDLSDRIVGLELGADDYLPKPYEPRELVARIQSVLRRARGVTDDDKKNFLVSSELVLDLNRAAAALAEADLELTTAEFSVLRLLMAHAGRTMSRDEIVQQMRGSQWDNVDRTVDMIVSRLRNKLRDDSKNPRFLKTMWGEGYRFVGSVDEK